MVLKSKNNNNIDKIYRILVAFGVASIWSQMCLLYGLKPNPPQFPNLLAMFDKQDRGGFD